MGTWWQGPIRVVARVGESSYQVRHHDGKVSDVHITALKLCVGMELGEFITDLQVPPGSTPPQSDDEEGEESEGPED